MSEPFVFTQSEANEIECYLDRFLECVESMPFAMRQFDSERLTEQITDVDQQARIKVLIDSIKEIVS
jgi:hypothetical protein